MGVPRYIRSAAFKVIALQTLPAARPAGSSCFMPRCFVRAIVNSVVSTSGCITRCSEREVTVLCHLVRNVLKMSKLLTPDSFDTELFITEMEQMPAVWDSR